MRMCQIIFDAMFRSSHEHDRCRVIILLVLNSIGPAWSIRQPGVLNKCEVQGQEDLQLGRCQGGRHGPRQDEVEPHRPRAQQPDVCDHGMAARLAKLHAIDVEYKRTRFVFKGMLLPWTRTLQAQNCRRCACAELSALCVCRVPCGEGGVPEPRAWRAGHHVSLPGRPNRHRRPRVAQVRSSSWKFMTWSMSLAPQGQLHFRVVVTGGYKGKWVWADREVYDTGVQITRLCFPCDTHEWR